MEKTDQPEASLQPPRLGLLFDEFELGQVYRTPARTMTETDIVAFAGLSGDYYPLHLDDEFARRGPFRGRVAHGLLVQSMATGLAFHSGIFRGTMAALVEIEMRFEAPVRPGDTIHVDLTVLEKEPEPGPNRGWMRFRTAVINQRGERVMDGEWRPVMLRRHPPRRAVE